MLGRRNIRDSIGYVTLGLFSYALLNELSEAKSKPDTPPQKRKVITIAIESLQAITSPEEVQPSSWRNLVFQNYQEVRTLYGVFTTQQGINEPGELKCILDEIVQDGTTKSKRLTYICTV
jgi:hypothetical protein